jgi:putative hemolysin
MENPRYGNRISLEYVDLEHEMRSIIIILAALTICPEGAWALANPASVFCVKSGGKSEIRKGPRGKYGVCRLPNGRVVEEWTYFREMKGTQRSR